MTVAIDPVAPMVFPARHRLPLGNVIPVLGAYTPLRDFFLALGLAAFVVEAWAFIDAIRRPAQAFVATGKQTKPLWLILLGVAAVVGLAGAVYGVGPTSFLPVAAFVVEAWAFIDASRRPTQAFVATGKQTKQLWLIILGGAAVVGLAGAVYGVGPTSILPVAAFVAAAVYLADVRPKVKDFRNGGGNNSGPYGPW